MGRCENCGYRMESKNPRYFFYCRLFETYPGSLEGCSSYVDNRYYGMTVNEIQIELNRKHEKPRKYTRFELIEV